MCVCMSLSIHMLLKEILELPNTVVQIGLIKTVTILSTHRAAGRLHSLGCTSTGGYSIIGIRTHDLPMIG